LDAALSPPEQDFTKFHKNGTQKASMVLGCGLALEAVVE